MIWLFFSFFLILALEAISPSLFSFLFFLRATATTGIAMAHGARNLLTMMGFVW
jgi:hypothetical protein